MKLCIDARESDKIEMFKEYISNRNTIIDDIEVGMYDVSDVHTPDMLVGIERKAKDFVSSMFDGRLEKQLIELKENFVYPFLFIEYDGIQDMILDNPNVNYKAILGEIASIVSRHRITILFTGRSLYVPIVVRTIEKFYDSKNKVKEYTPIRSKPSKRKPSIQEVKLDVISRIPGVGRKRGLKLLEEFNYSIEKISKANLDEIMKINGIGKILANQIKEVLK